MSDMQVLDLTETRHAFSMDAAHETQCRGRRPDEWGQGTGLGTAWAQIGVGAGVSSPAPQANNKNIIIATGAVYGVSTRS